MTAVTRGTTNGNVRGNSETRRRRREWLIQTYRADLDACSECAVKPAEWQVDIHGLPHGIHGLPHGEGTPACRCYRCGTLLTVDTVTVDRIVPGIHGGTYRRSNIRPACGRCNSETGGAIRRKNGAKTGGSVVVATQT